MRAFVRSAVFEAIVCAASWTESANAWACCSNDLVDIFSDASTLCFALSSSRTATSALRRDIIECSFRREDFSPETSFARCFAREPSIPPSFLAMLASKRLEFAALVRMEASLLCMAACSPPGRVRPLLTASSSAASPFSCAIFTAASMFFNLAAHSCSGESSNCPQGEDARETARGAELPCSTSRTGILSKNVFMSCFIAAALVEPFMASTLPRTPSMLTLSRLVRETSSSAPKAPATSSA